MQQCFDSFPLTYYIKKKKKTTAKTPVKIWTGSSLYIGLDLEHCFFYVHCELRRAVRSEDRERDPAQTDQVCYVPLTLWTVTSETWNEIQCGIWHWIVTNQNEMNHGMEFTTDSTLDCHKWKWDETRIGIQYGWRVKWSVPWSCDSR